MNDKIFQQINSDRLCILIAKNIKDSLVSIQDAYPNTVRDKTYKDFLAVGEKR